MDENVAIEKAETWAVRYKGWQCSATFAVRMTRDFTQEDWWRRVPLLERRIAVRYLNNWIVTLQGTVSDGETPNTHTVAVDDSTGIVSVIE